MYITSWLDHYTTDQVGFQGSGYFDELTTKTLDQLRTEDILCCFVRDVALKKETVTSGI